MLPLEPYNINYIRRIFSHIDVVWDIYVERDDHLEAFFLKCKTSPLLKMEMEASFAVRQPIMLERTIKQALILGWDCLGPILHEILFDFSSEMYVVALGRYFHNQKILADDNYLGGYDFRLSILCDVIRIMMRDRHNQKRDEVVESFLDFLPLTYKQHKGIMTFFSSHVNELPQLKLS